MPRWRSRLYGDAIACGGIGGAGCVVMQEAALSIAVMQQCTARWELRAVRNV
ncbi:hypothetical protein [Paenibacillus lentus]|uniref:hypothetical protein n=1 Tax=Paenibacillus lentus TaxID=1338368 RepID=UPI0013DDA77D|nr:hypothetical protein [Paenibacillus lentus]